MPSDDYLLSILATFKDSASPELKKLGQSITGVEKATDAAKPKAKSFGSSITALSGQFLVATQAAGQVVAAVKQMYEFAKVGAVVQQTEDSFDGLIDKLGVTPDLLDDLREASDGTISDMRLMSATTTLLAGAQGELASALADATPELLEIAKAANKLNPSLGDTAFLYESLATGIKRASPMILDNLGLTIKIGEANEKYAASIGKTVEQLTAEEQKLALLIETRRAGNVLIEQAGGAAGSATDDFARLEAATENLSNAFKKQLTPSVANFAEALADMLTERQTLEKLLRDETQAVLETSKSYDEYVSQANEVVAAHGFIYDSTGQLTEAMKEWNLQTGEEFLISTGKAVEGAKILTEQQYDLLASLDDMGPTVRRTGDNFGYYEEELYRVVAAEKIAEDAALKLEAAQLRINDALGDLATTMSGAVGDEIDDYAKKHASLADDLRKAERSIAELRAEEGFPTEDQLGRLGDYRANALGIADDMRTLAEEHREAMNSIVFDLTMARLEADGFTEAELTLATSLAEGMGLVDERTATAMRNINSSISTFDEGGNLGQAADDILAIASGLTDIEVPTGVTAALGSGIGLVENWGVLAQEQIGTTYAETTSSVEEAADFVTEEIAGLQDEVIGLTEERYEMDIAIKDRDLFLESLASAESMVKFLSGTHTVSLRLQTSGAMPGAAAPPAAAAVGGGPIPRFQTGGIVEETGLAFVHAGELIIPPIEAQQMREGGGGTTITEGDVNNFNLNVTTTQELSSIMQEFAVMQAMAG